MSKDIKRMLLALDRSPWHDVGGISVWRDSETHFRLAINSQIIGVMNLNEAAAFIAKRGSADHAVPEREIRERRERQKSLSDIASVIWGDEWVSPAARHLDVDVRTVQRWMSQDGRMVPPAGIEQELRDVAKLRMEELARMQRTLVKFLGALRPRTNRQGVSRGLTSAD